MKSILDMFKTIDKFYKYLSKVNFQFDENGFPIFTKDMFLYEQPDLIVPYNARNSKYVIDKRRTVICTFMNDKYIYPRFNKIFNEIGIYREYMGVVTPDLTVTSDMDIEWQEFIILFNQLFAAVLAANNIKILLNTRLGTNNNISLFSNYPSNIILVSSFLGCNNNNIYDCSYVSKIMGFLPSKLLIYGKNDKNVNKMLDAMGINYSYYVDFHRLCKGVS